MKQPFFKEERFARMKRIEINLQIFSCESFARMKLISLKIITQCGLPMLCCAIGFPKLLKYGAILGG